MLPEIQHCHKLIEEWAKKRSRVGDKFTTNTRSKFNLIRF